MKRDIAEKDIEQFEHQQVYHVQVSSSGYSFSPCLEIFFLDGPLREKTIYAEEIEP